LPAERTIVLTANSSATLSSSTVDTEALIRSGIEQLDENAPNTTHVPETGHYVSRIGDARVVWRKDDNRIVVLTVFTPKT
jgi:hypothetical protein